MTAAGRAGRDLHRRLQQRALAVVGGDVGTVEIGVEHADAELRHRVGKIEVEVGHALPQILALEDFGVLGKDLRREREVGRAKKNKCKDFLRFGWAGSKACHSKTTALTS